MPGAVDVFGTATSGVNVRIASQHLPPESAVGSAQEFFSYYSGLSHATTQKTVGAETFFYGAETVDNSAAGVKKDMLIVGVKPGAGPGNAAAVRVETKSVFLPKTPELSTYDIDGNQTSDGLWQYRWDAENRLIEMETSASAVTAGMPKQKLTYTYDAQSRRVSKQLWSWVANSYTLTATTRFLYDGWNLVAELSATGTLQRRHTWGLDLSGSEQGAGGVAGLLVTQTLTPTSSTIHLPTYDGNGNVLTLINATTGTIEATYEYTPFGALLRATGIAAKSNPFRFSTKYCDEETGNYYYGYRYYKTLEARWLNKDPIGERGGANLYGMVGNDSLGKVDVLGLNPPTRGKIECVRCKENPNGPIVCTYSDTSGNIPYVFISNYPELHNESATGDFDWNHDGSISDDEKNTNLNFGDPARTAKMGTYPYTKYGRFGPIPPGNYVLSPVTRSGDFYGNASINSPSDPNGNGHIIAGNQNSGDVSRAAVYIHLCGASQGCFTTPAWTRVRDSMNANENHLPLTLKEICCGDRALVPLPKATQSLPQAGAPTFKSFASWFQNLFKR